MSNYFEKEKEIERRTKLFAEEEKVRDQEYLNKFIDISFGTTTEEIEDKIQYLCCMGVGLTKADLHKKARNIIKEKIEFGIRKLRSLGKSVEADFFETKLLTMK